MESVKISRSGVEISVEMILSADRADERAIKSNVKQQNCCEMIMSLST